MIIQRPRLAQYAMPNAREAHLPTSPNVSSLGDESLGLSDELELTDEELDLVAGGLTRTWTPGAANGAAWKPTPIHSQHRNAS